MALLSKNEFCELCNVKIKDFSIYVSRGNVIVKDNLLDSNNEINKKFIEKRKSRFIKTESKEEQPNKPIQKTNVNLVIPESTPLVDVESHEGQSYTESERQLKYLDTLKRRKEIEKLEFEVQKKRGEVVPSELIKPVFLQHNQSILTEYKNATDEIIRIFSKKRSLTVDEVAEIKTDLVKTINNAINNAIIISSKSIDSIISDHSDKRGVGEHG